MRRPIPWMRAPKDSAQKSGSKLARVTGIRHWSSADSSTVVLDLEDQVQYEAHRLANPDRIYFDLHDTSLAPELDAKDYRGWRFPALACARGATYSRTDARCA